MRTRLKERIQEGSNEYIESTYGLRGRQDPIAVERQANLKEQRLTKHKWLGRLVMGPNFAQQEQRMRADIADARRAVQPPVEPQPVYHYNFETGELTRNPLAEQPQAEQSQGPTYQQPEQQPTHAPAEAVNSYAPRHAAGE